MGLMEPATIVQAPDIMPPIPMDPFMPSIFISSPIMCDDIPLGGRKC